MCLHNLLQPRYLLQKVMLSVTVIAPDVVFTKYPLPLTAVKPAVFAVVSQLTVPVLPNPVCDAPDARETVSPLAPIVIVLELSLMMLAPH